MPSPSYEDLQQAFRVLDLTEPLTRERLEAKRRELLRTWYPPRYAGLTNNPRKYMEMYRKGETMTRQIESAYRLLTEWLDDRDRSPT